MGKNFYSHILIGICSLAAALALSFAVVAWTEPQSAPPAGNIAAPLNASANAQTKAGDLKIGQGLTITNTDGGSAFALKANDRSVENDGKLRFVVGQDGNVGIGTTAPGQKLEVAGNVNAEGFCLAGKCCTDWDECFGAAADCDQCSPAGLAQCADGDILRTCSDTDGDGCLEWNSESCDDFDGLVCQIDKCCRKQTDSCFGDEDCCGGKCCAGICMTGGLCI